MRVLYNSSVMLKVLMATSTLFFLSLAVGHLKLMGLTFSVWIANVGWLVYLSFVFSPSTFSDVSEVLESRISTAKKNNEYIEYGVYALVKPLCLVGVVILGLTIFFLFAS